MTDTPSPELRTLIVDDEPLAVERMQVICARLPELRVIGTASDGAAALRLIDALSPELVLLDLSMPVMDGTATAEALLATRPELPIVAMSGLADDDAVGQLRNLRIAGFIPKPFAPEHLAQVVAVARRSYK